MKTCPICQQSFPTKAALAAHRAVHQAGGARSARRRARRSNTSGVNSQALKEYWGTITANSVITIDIKPSDSKLPKLSTIGSIYEQYKVVNFVVHLVHSAGVAKDGTYFAGVSFSSKHPSDKKGVASLSPNICKGVSSDGTIAVPCSRIMGQAWLDTTSESPGAVCVYSDQKLEAWVSYRVLFSGPTNVAQISGFDTFYQTDGSSWKDEAGRVVRRLVPPYSAYGELEVNVDDATHVDTAWAAFRAVVTTAERIHSAYQRAVGVVHFLMDVGSYAFPVLGVPAILHVQRRPFRASGLEWSRVRVDIPIKEEG